MPSQKLLWLLPLFVLAACAQGGNVDSYTASAVPVSEADGVADTSLVTGVPGAINSPHRKVIRTADFHCKVPDVLHAVTLLEHEVKALGGIVEESQVDNVNSRNETVAYNADSLKQVQVYTTTAALTLRVPVTLLDSVTDAIHASAAFIESRRTAQSDVTLKYLSNALLNKPDDAAGKVKKALQVANSGADAIAAQRYGDDIKERSIARKIENLQLMDNVSYATLTVSFSQPERVFVQIVVNPDNVTQVPFATRCSAALQSGVRFVGDIFVGLLSIWPLLLILLTVMFLGLAVMRQKRRVALR